MGPKITRRMLTLSVTFAVAHRATPDRLWFACFPASECESVVLARRDRNRFRAIFVVQREQVRGRLADVPDCCPMNIVLRQKTMCGPTV